MRAVRWVMAVLFSLGGCAGAAQAGLPLTKMQLVERKATYEVDYEYPRTGNRIIDNEIGNWVREFAQGFGEQARRDHQMQELRPYTAQLRYDIARNDDKVFAVVFHYAFDLGGAHPNSATFTFNYLMPDAWRVFLAEIVRPDGWRRVSDLAIADLKRRVASGPDALSTDDWVRRGAAPESYNFAEFTLLQDEILIHFDPYQVAAYAAGPQAAHIPLRELQSVMRPDWRAPQPSFDCAKAQTKIEHTLCANVNLARLDRQVADEYFHQVSNDPEGSYAAKIKSLQRDWLAKRDRDCAAAVSTSSCLLQVYNDRMAALLRGN